jgi:amino acid transporter
VGTAGLLALGFFWVSGGIFGNEALMQAAPPAHVFGSLVLASVFYALPISLMTGELAAALPYNGGMVAWVTEACGPMIGAQNMWWIWVSTLLDSAIYPVLAAHYLAKRVDLGALSVGGSSTTESTTRLIANMFIALVTLVKLGGTDCMVRSTKVLACVATVPVLIFIMAGVSKIDLPAVTSTDASDDAGGSDFALLTSWVLWLYSGFFFLGSLAGEVKDPQRVYPIVALTLVPVVTLLCIAPLAVAVSIDPNRTHYVAGHFDTVATSLVGDWLGVCFIIAACVSQIGLFNGDMVVAERSLASFFDGHLLQVGGDRRWRLTRFFVEENGTGVAPIYIVFNAGVAACLTGFSYQDLVEFQMMQFAVSVSQAPSCR